MSGTDVGNAEDGSELFRTIAAPLMDMQDRSFNAFMRKAEVESGDLQSQLLLAYHGCDRDSTVFSNQIIAGNRLGWHKFLQAVLPTPIVAALCLAIESSFIPDVGLLCLVVLGFSFFVVLALILLDIAWARGARSWTRLCQPDRIAISPQGLNLQYTGRFFTYIGLVLPWKRIALAYMEESDAGERVLCLRDNVGKTLRLDAEAFDNPTMLRNLQRRAPWTVKDAPKILALQPTQKTRLRYLLDWLAQIYGKSKGVSPQTLKVGDTIAVRYTIRQALDHELRSNCYIAEVVGKEEVHKRWLSEDGTSEPSALVRIQQWLLPPNGSLRNYYDLLREIERRSKQHSRSSLNSLNRWLDVFVENKSIFVVTEYDASPTLRQLVAERGPLAEREARTAAVEMLDNLSYLHEGDPHIIKSLCPDSWLWTASGKLKLDRIDCDMYLAPSRFECLGIDNRYCSLDQLRGAPSRSSDLYAMSGILYFLVTGKDPQPFSSFNPLADGAKISEAFNKFILKGGQPDPSLRYQSAEEMKADLLALAAEETSLILL
jgi:hypothetical protein